MLQLQTLHVRRSNDVEGTSHILSDLRPQGKGQRMYFLINTSPKLLNIHVATVNLAGAYVT